VNEGITEKIQKIRKLPMAYTKMEHQRQMNLIADILTEIVRG